MPIYEYDCPRCGLIEAIQKVSDAPFTECPQCAKKGIHSSVQRRVSLSSFQLKGSGWYVTDYKGKNTCNDTPPASTTPKADTKPAASVAQSA